MPQQDQAAQFSYARTRKARPRARNRTERLARALAHLERAGINRHSVYSRSFRALARIGLILKPLHYRSLPGLTLVGFALLCVLSGAVVALSLAIGVVPGPLRAVLETGPAGFFAINGMLGLVFAGLIRFQAIGAKLPSWRDL